MSLSNGSYIVTSVADDRHVGRHPVEDRSGFPKQVFALPKNIPAPHLILEKTDKGYKIKAGGAPTGVLNGAVFAFLREGEGEQSEDWIIKAEPHQGDNVFIVAAQDSSKGWVRDEEEGNRGFEIKIRTLISFPTFPPRSPISQLFTFTRIDED